MILRFLTPAVALWLQFLPLASAKGQSTATDSSLRAEHRADCARAAQELREKGTGAAMGAGRIRICQAEIGDAVAPLWARTPTDSVGWELLLTASTGYLDSRILAAVTRLALDPAAPPNARAMAVVVMGHYLHGALDASVIRMSEPGTWWPWFGLPLGRSPYGPAPPEFASRIAEIRGNIADVSRNAPNRYTRVYAEHVLYVTRDVRP